MASNLAPWELRVDRGSNWLLVKAHRDEAGSADASLTEQLWALMEQRFTFRLVLELDRNASLEGIFLQQLVSLDERARTRNGFVRLCGLPVFQRQRLRHIGHSNLYDLLSVYDDIRDVAFSDPLPRSAKQVGDS